MAQTTVTESWYVDAAFPLIRSAVAVQALVPLRFDALKAAVAVPFVTVAPPLIAVRLPPHVAVWVLGLVLLSAEADVTVVRPLMPAGPCGPVGPAGP